MKVRTEMTAQAYKSRIEAELEKQFSDAVSLPQAGLADAMRYSLLAGGKRIRPMLVLEFCRIAGGDPPRGPAPADAGRRPGGLSGRKHTKEQDQWQRKRIR